MAFIYRVRALLYTVMALAFAAILLSACTAQIGNVDDKGLQPHLTVDLLIPEKLKVNETNPFRVEVKQGGEPVEAEEVTFELWPEGKPDHTVSIQGTRIGDGLYGFDYSIPENGLYILKSRVISGKLEVFPAKRFAIGEEAVLQLASLEQHIDQENQSPSHSADGHHHH